MAPPFIAYYGAYDQGDNQAYLLQVAYDQCRLYRQYLQDNSTKLWKHIQLGLSQDNNLWATGNGWAAAGMFRVLQTIHLSDSRDSFLDQQNDLLDWIEEIVKASWCYQVSIRIISSSCDHAASTSRSLTFVAYRHPMAPSGISSTIPARSRTLLQPL
jgi:rhamnogalacturonyl hydrolase YesR